MVITKFLESLSRRRALKSFTRNGAPLDITPILEAARLAPSSFGVQPYFIHVVTSPELKQAIYPIAYSQDQIIESSHLLIFSARSDSNEAVERYLKDSATEGGYANMIRQSFSNMDSTAFHDFAKNQAFISLGFALSAAAVMKVGSCPMTGFQPKELKKILQLPEFEDPVAIMAVGHAPEDDSPKANPFPKYRFAMDYFVKYHT